MRERIDDRLTDEELEGLLKFNREQQKKQKPNILKAMRNFVFKFLGKPLSANKKSGLKLKPKSRK